MSAYAPLRGAALGLALSVWLLLPAAQAASPTTGSQPTSAAPRLRVAFVDTARILRDSAVAKAASKKLEQTFEPRRRKLAQLGQRIEALRARLQDNTVVMSDNQRMQAQQQLADLTRQFRDDQQAFAEDLNAQRNADVSRILDKANAIVEQVAREKGCDIVFQSAVYVNPRIDITDDVIRALDAGQAAR
jgi:outer membrane protein